MCRTPTRRLRIALTHRPLPYDPDSQPVLMEVLHELGHDVTVVRSARDAWQSCDLLWLDHNPSWFPDLGRALERRRAGDGATPRVLVWHSEPLPLPRAAPFPRPRPSLRELAKIVLRDARATDPWTNARILRRMARRRLYDLLAVTTPARQAYLAEQGIDAALVPFGYHPSDGRDLGLERDIDVLFLGDLRVPRRQRLLAQLRRRGLRVECAGSWFTTDAWGESRTRLLNRTKILLNLQRFPGELAGQRMILGMANRALVVSEPIYMPGPYVEGTHWLSAQIDRMPDVIAAHLAEPASNRAIIEAGFDLVTRTLTLAKSAAHILDLVLAARPELGRPSPTPPQAQP